MRTERRIREQIDALRKQAQDESLPQNVRDIAYESWHALVWVLEPVTWTPSDEIKKRASREP